MGKKRIQEIRDIRELRMKTKQFLDNYYYDKWMAKFVISGLDEDEKQDRKLNKYLLNQFWETGSIAAFLIKHTKNIGLCPFEVRKHDYLTMPEQVMLINKWNAPFLPSKKPQVVNKDVVIGYAAFNRKPISWMVGYYVKQLIDIKMIMNTNANLQKIPFVLGISAEEKLKAEDLINRILNDEIAVIVDVKDLDLIKALVTNAPYILDKLYAHYQAIEGELKTYLGIDNTANDPSKEFQLVDEINSNNGIIQSNEDNFKTNLQNFINDANSLWGTSIKLEEKTVQALSVYDNQKKQVTPGGNDNDRT